MLAKRIIPCLDVDKGRVVKGTNFVNLKDAGDPVEVAARYDQEGADELVFLDITASHEDRGILLEVVRRTAEVCFMPLTVGGGIRSLDEIRTLLSAGAVSGQFAQFISSPPPSAFLSLSGPFYDPTSVDVILTRTPFGAVPGLSRNQRAVGNAHLC